MRKNTQAALLAFVCASSLHQTRSIHTDGRTLYSYDTAIATRWKRADGVDWWIVNVTPYSSTTSEKQREAVKYLSQGAEVHKVRGVPRGERYLLKYA